MKVIAIIPAYNEEKTIGNVIDEIRKKSDIDIVVVSDGSKDYTAKVARKKGAKVIELKKNHGVGYAMRTGYQYANRNNYDIAVQVDADGQHDINYLDKLINHICEGDYDMVIGSRFVKKTDYSAPFFRYIGIQYFSFLIYLLHKKNIKDTTSGYRAVNKKMIHYFADYYPSGYPEVIILSLLLENCRKVCEIPVGMRERQAGKSSITWQRAICYFFSVTFLCIKQKINCKRDKDYGKDNKTDN